MVNRFILSIVIFCIFSMPIASQEISGRALGIYDENERLLLPAYFITTVTEVYRRYQAGIMERGEDYFKMQVNYGYLFDVELFVRDNEYEIIVIPVKKVLKAAQTRNLASKIAAQIFNRLEKRLVRGTRVRDRTDRNGVR